MKSEVTLIVKCTRRCNLRCVYCHDWRVDGARHLNFQDVLQLIDLAAKHYRNVNLIWHGGEPLLLGRDYFDKVLLAQQLVTERKGTHFTNSLQTNGTLVDDNWALYLASRNFKIGISIDGPSDMHDAARYDIKNQGTYDRVVSAARALKAAGARTGFLLVVSEATAALGAKAIYGWALSEGIGNIAFLPQRPDPEQFETTRTPSRSSVFLSRSLYSQFMSEMLDLWWESDAEGPTIREFESLLQGVLGRRSFLCIHQGSCVGNYFGIDVNGDVYHCDRYIPEPRYRIGNFMEPDFAFDGVRTTQIAAIAAIGERASMKCRHYQVCHGGCPHDRHADPAGWSERGECCGLEAIIDRLEQRVEATTAQALAARGKTPKLTS